MCHANRPLKSNLLNQQGYLLLFILFTMLAFSKAWAQTDPLPAGHQVNFSFEQTTKLENDTLQMRFAAIQDGDTSKQVSLEINRQMQQAKQLLQAMPLESVQTGNYRVIPIYDKDRKLSHWRGQQTLTLTAQTNVDLTPMLNKLQSLLAFQSMQFTLSSNKRQLAEKSLLNTALQGYQAKASAIAKSFGHPTYRLLETSITPNFSAPIMRHNTPLTAQARAASIEAPLQEKGHSEIHIRIQGTLILSH